MERSLLSLRDDNLPIQRLAWYGKLDTTVEVGLVSMARADYHPCGLWLGNTDILIKPTERDAFGLPLRSASSGSAAIRQD